MLAVSLDFCNYCGQGPLAEPQQSTLPRVAKAAPAYRSAKGWPGPRTPALWVRDVAFSVSNGE
jgi:hypothetical protein